MNGRVKELTNQPSAAAETLTVRWTAAPQSIDPRLQLFFIIVPLLLRAREKNPANPKLPAQILIFVCVFIYLFFARPHKHSVLNREKAASSGLWLHRPSEKHSMRLVIEVEHWHPLSWRVSLLIHHQIFSQNEWTIDQNVPLKVVMNYNDRRYWTGTGGDGIGALMSRAAERRHTLALHRLLYPLVPNSAKFTASVF